MENKLSPDAFAILFRRWLDNLATPEETEALLVLMGETEYYQLSMDLIEGGIDEDVADSADDEAVRERLQARLVQILAETKTARVVRLGWKRWIAAAAVIILIAGAGYFSFFDQAKRSGIQALADVAAPLSNKARITLGNGKTIYLDSVREGAQLASIGGFQLVKKADGQIVYENGNGEVAAPVSNTVTNPRGSKVIDLVLTDGTHVWLNAGSSITYTVPMVQRNVAMNGEAYFEVAKDASHPFTVSKGETKVTVLGTHFNVKAYENDAHPVVTLLEGSVLVSAAGASQKLGPGQQAVVEQNSITLFKDVDTEEVIAWKNGYINYYSTDLNTLLNEIERWYDIEIDNETGNGRYSNIEFYVNVERSVSLKGVLKVLDNSKVNYLFDEKNRKLIIKP